MAVETSREPWASNISSTLSPMPRRAALTRRIVLSMENPSRPTTRIFTALNPLAAYPAISCSASSPGAQPPEP